MDSYQAIFDAVRSKISNCDVGQAVESAVRDSNLSHAVHMVQQEYLNSAYEQQRPSVLFRPEVSIDGNKYCVLYGKDLMEGVAGFGDSLSEAMADFDKNWNAKPFIQEERG